MKAPLTQYLSCYSMNLTGNACTVLNAAVYAVLENFKKSLNKLSHLVKILVRQ